MSKSKHSNSIHHAVGGIGMIRAAYIDSDNSNREVTSLPPVTKNLTLASRSPSQGGLGYPVIDPVKVPYSIPYIMTFKELRL